MRGRVGQHKIKVLRGGRQANYAGLFVDCTALHPGDIRGSATGTLVVADSAQQESRARGAVVRLRVLTR